MEVRSIRGFHDILPEEIRRWHYIEEKAKTVFELYGFSEIRIPVIEFTEIFSRSLGTTTDIVEKEMYTFEDRDGSSLTLRPEGTAGVVRAFIENSMWAKSPVTKLYYGGMMFRHERPQKGRYRGFYQIGAEIFGPEEPSSDAELIAMVWRLFEEIGITEYLKLELSSLGDKNCRPQYKEKLTAYFTPQRGELCEDCRRRLETNPLRILDCKEKGCREIAERAPKMIDNLCADCTRHFDEVKENLESVGVPFVINPKIVRGLDYYTRTVFEITTEELGSQNAVAAGGRYDGLVEELGGPLVRRQSGLPWAWRGSCCFTRRLSPTGSARKSGCSSHTWAKKPGKRRLCSRPSSGKKASPRRPSTASRASKASSSAPTNRGPGIRLY